MLPLIQQRMNNRIIFYSFFIVLIGFITIITFLYYRSPSHIRSLSPPTNITRQPTSLPTNTPTSIHIYTISDIIALHNKLDSLFKESKFAAKGVEGNSAKWPHKTYSYYALTYGKKIKTICETGFNIGHSAITWLASNPEAHLYSFDLPHDYQYIGIDYINKLFPKRLTVVNGDSTRTMLPYMCKFNITCDVSHVDGGHSYEVATSDLNILGSRTNIGGLLLIDDTLCKLGFCVDRSWEDYIKGKQSWLLPIISGPDEKKESGFSGAYVINTSR